MNDETREYFRLNPDEKRYLPSSRVERICKKLKEIREKSKKIEDTNSIRLSVKSN